MVRDFFRKERKEKGTITDYVAPRFALLEVAPEELREVIDDFFDEMDVKIKELGKDVYCPSRGEEVRMPRYDIYVPGGHEVNGMLRLHRDHWEGVAQGIREKIGQVDKGIADIEMERYGKGVLKKLSSEGELREKKESREMLQRSLDGVLSEKNMFDEKLTAFEAGRSYTGKPCRMTRNPEEETRPYFWMRRVEVWPYKRALVITTTDTLKKGLHGTFADDYEWEADSSSITISSRLFDASAYQLAQELADYIHEQLPEMDISLRDHQDIEFYHLSGASWPTTRKAQFVLYEERIEEE